MQLFRINGNKQLKGTKLFSRYQLCLFIILVCCMQGVVQWLKIPSEVLDILTITQIIQIVFLRFLFQKAWWLILPLTNFTWRIVYLASKYWFLVCWQVVNVGRGPVTCITFSTECKASPFFSREVTFVLIWLFERKLYRRKLFSCQHVFSSFNNFLVLEWRKAEFPLFYHQVIIECFPIWVTFSNRD